MLSFKSFGQKGLDLEPILDQNENLKNIINNNGEYQVQILFTQVDKGFLGKPKFTTYQFGLNTNQYFYPASTVKLPACLMALEKLNQLKIRGLDKNTTMLTRASKPFLTEVKHDSTAQNLKPSVAQYIKKILLVSDNDAFNRLYEFIGQDEFQQKLVEKGMTKSKIVHRLEAGVTYDQTKRPMPSIL